MIHFDESFWLAIAFFVFIGMIARPVGKVISRALDKRTAIIKAELDEAQRLKEEAQALLASYQRKHRKAEEEATEILRHAKNEAKHVIKEAKDKLERDIEKRAELAMQKIAQAEASVVQEIRENAVDITVSAARTLIVENLGKEEAEEIISSAVGDINQKFH